MPSRYAKACKLYVASLGTWTARVPATTPVRAWKEAVLCFAASEDGRRILASMRGALELRLANQDERDSATAGHLESDPEHKAMLRDLDEQAAVVVRIEAALGYLRDTQRNARVLLLARSPSELIFEAEDLGVAPPTPAAGSTTA